MYGIVDWQLSDKQVNILFTIPHLIVNKAINLHSYDHKFHLS